MATTQNTHTVTDADIERLFVNADAVITAATIAISRYRDSIMSDIAVIRSFHTAYRTYYARFCVVSANLSTGADLDASFDAAHVIVERLFASPDTAPQWEELKHEVAERVAGCAVLNAGYQNVCSHWHALATLTGEDMSYAGIRNQIAKYGTGFRGMGAKTTSWALALWHHGSSVMTLDRHMLRGLCGFIGGGAVSISEARYASIATLMLDIADVLNADPLVMQWALWNTYRGDKHADHTGAVPTWYRNA